MDLEYLKNKKILLVDDEPELLSMVEGILEKEGYQNIPQSGFSKGDSGSFSGMDAGDGSAGCDACLTGTGLNFFEKIREQSDIPVLFLTARGEEEDKFLGLGLGADDYIVKPFLPKELTLRIGVILRRCYKEEQPVARLAACSIDFERAQVIKEGERLPLTAKEFALLSALYRNGGKIVTIDMLCQAVWGDNPYGYENSSLMAHIRRITGED